VLIAIGILALLEIALGVGLWTTFNDACLAHEKITAIELRLTKLHDRINTVADESKIISHERLVDDLWQRASEQIDLLQRDSEQIDQEIEKARARGRGF
jgi:hypothetical protein